MIELRWKKVIPTPHDSFLPDNAMKTEMGYAVLQYRENGARSGDILPDEIEWNWTDWQDVEIIE